MATDVERLLVRLEVTQRSFERQLAAANNTADRRARAMERRFQTASRHMSRSFERVGHTAGTVFNGIARAAAAVGLALGTREVLRYADAWTNVENKIRAAEQISGTQARTTARLNDIAERSRAGLEETADIYARMLRVSGDLGASEEEVAQATETVAKAFKAGGAAASEQAAGIMQLSQALSSGVLQGDELRSLRENAPLVAQAIADEFETTIGGLKELGSEGELTAQRVFRALLNAQEGIEEAFASTVPTIGEGFRLMQNGLTELIGGFNEGSGAAGGFAGSMADLGSYLSDNAEAARRFGAQVSEAFKIMRENIDRTAERLSQMGSGVDIAEQDIREFVQRAIDAIQTVIATASGTGAAIGQAMLNAVDAVANGSVQIANAAISAVEGILNTILAGIQQVSTALNALVKVHNATNFLLPDIPEIDVSGSASLGRVPEPGRLSSGGVSDAFMQRRDEVQGYLDALEEQATSRLNRIRNAGLNSGPHHTPPPGYARPGSGVGGFGGGDGGGAGGGSRGGGGGRSVPPLFEDIDKQIDDLNRQIETIGLTTAEIARLKAETELLHEAQERGLDLNARNASTGETLRQEISRQAETVGELTAKYEDAQARAEGFKAIQQELGNAFIDAVIEGENFAGMLEDLAKSLARAAMQAALLGEGPLAGLFGTSSGGGLLGTLASSFGGGRASGGPVYPGKIYAVNENTGRTEFFAPKVPGTILTHEQATRGAGGGGAANNINLTVVENATDGPTRVEQSGSDVTVLMRKALRSEIGSGNVDTVLRQRFGITANGKGR